MAALACSDEVMDKEYTNWLSVNLALYYMKLGLHTFIKREVDCLHQSLVQKLYGGQTVSLPPCTICHASRVKRDEYGVWAFKKRCRSDCDVWLAELLALHVSPKSEEIYWNNSHAPSWPFQPWECAKVFMPRGQQPSNTGPAECDTQSLLMLLAKCTHFHPKLSPKGLSLRQTISTIRNKVIHHGEMKVSNADRTSFMQQIIQLLEDPVQLKSLEDCKAAVSNINKIDNDSLDLDLEMTTLRAVVNELRLELGIQEKRALDTVNSLKDEYKKFREQITERFEDVSTKKLPIQEDVQPVKSQTNTLVQQEQKHHDMPTTVISHEVKQSTNVEELGTKFQECETGIPPQRGNNSNRKRKAVGKGISDSGIPEKLHRSVLNRCLPVLLRDLDFKTVSIYVQQKEIFDDVTMSDILDDGAPSEKKKGLIQRIQQRDHDTYEKFKECLVLAKQGDLKDMLEEEEERVAINRETTPKRRPESDGLKQLKSQTEDKLDTVKRLRCIQTTQAVEAGKLLQEKRSVVIKGNPGEGKTTIAFDLIDNEMYSDRRVVVYSPRDWKTVDTEWVDIVVLEDILGKYDFDPSSLQEWMVYLPTIQEHVDSGKLQVIITTRVDILAKADSKLGSLKLFSNHLSLTLSSKNLSKSEKMSILNRELQRHDKNMKEDEIEKCITNFRGLIGFPQSCLLFAADSKLFERGPEFFKSPKELFFENICNLKAEKFISLAFLFCHGKIYEEYLSPETMPKSSNDVFMELASCLHISKKKADITLLRDAYENLGGMYIEKSISNEIVKGVSVKKSCIWFSHATVCEAVGQVLAKHSLEMVVKHGDPEYLYQRTYTAEAKDKTSENVFLPVSMYSSMAERMVHDVVEKNLAKRAAKHSILKQNEFFMKLKDVLHKDNRIKDFFMANSYSELKFRFFLMAEYELSKGKCLTFLQYVLQCDDSTVKLVYSHFLGFLACTHDNNSSDCWKCKEKQKLLELALYYHHFEIADRLIAMNACYTHVSLCNAARHGDLSRVQIIMEYLKSSLIFNPECIEAKQALCRAYLSRSQDVIDILLQEGITLDSMHVVHVVQDGDISVLMKVVEHLKDHDMWHPSSEQEGQFPFYFHSHRYSDNFAKVHDKWHPHLGPDIYSSLFGKPYARALYIAYCNEKFDMADYLVKNEAVVSLKMLAAVANHSTTEAVARVIQHLKVNCIWDPHCDDASEVLGRAYGAQKYDVCDLLVQEGVSMTIKNLPHVVSRSELSLTAVKKAVTYLKDTDSWDPKCNDASNALLEASSLHNYEVCDLLIEEGVSLTMKYVPHMMLRSLDDVKKVVKQLKDTDSWEPKCDDASKALAQAYREKKYDVCDLLIQEGVSLTIKDLRHVVGGLEISLEAVKKAVKHLKDTNNWDPKCKDVSHALELAYMLHNYDMWDLLVLEGVSVTMKHISHVILRSLDYVKAVVKQLKDTDSWDPKCGDASKALAKAYGERKYDVCDLLIQEGVSLTMKNLPHVVEELEMSLEDVKKVVQHLKDTNSWDPKCQDASKVLEEVYREKKYDVCDLLIQEGVSLTMKNLPHVVWGFEVSFKTLTKAVQHLKDTDSWDPKCDDASKALEKACAEKRYDVCDLLIQEGVSLTMKNLPCVVGGFEVSLKIVMKAVKLLKDTDNWDPKCEDASKALEEAYTRKRYDVCDLLIQEGVSLTMKNFPQVVEEMEMSLEAVKKVVQHLQDTNSWDPKCEDVSKVLDEAYREKKYDVCNLLIQKGVSLTMKNLPHVVGGFEVSFKTVTKAVQHLKDTDSWDPKCDDASKALEEAFVGKKYDVCNLLIQEGVLLTMKNLPGVVYRELLEKVKNAMHHLSKYALCNLLILDKVLLTIKNLYLAWPHQGSLERVKKAVEHLKDHENWDAKSDEASEALANAYSAQMYDVCELLLEETVSLTMKNFPGVVGGFEVSLEAVKKAMQHLKAIDSWDPKCDDASKALANAYSKQKYDVCDMLIQEGVSLTMQTFDGVVEGFQVSLEAVKKALQHLKDTGNWDPSSEHSSKALENAYVVQKYDVCDLLFEEGVSLSMKNVPGVVYSVSLEYVKKAIQHLNKYDLFDLLVLKRASVTMKNLPCVELRSRVSLEAVKKVIQHLKDTGNWDPRCDYASKALTNAYSAQIYDVCDLLAQEGVLTNNEESSSCGAGNSGIIGRQYNI